MPTHRHLTTDFVTRYDSPHYRYFSFIMKHDHTRDKTHSKQVLLARPSYRFVVAPVAYIKASPRFPIVQRSVCVWLFPRMRGSGIKGKVRRLKSPRAFFFFFLLMRRSARAHHLHSFTPRISPVAQRAKSKTTVNERSLTSRFFSVWRKDLGAYEERWGRVGRKLMLEVWSHEC